LTEIYPTLLSFISIRPCESHPRK